MLARISLFLLFFLTTASASALTYQDEVILGAGMNCYETNDLACAKEHFEHALSRRESEMNSAQRQAIKKILYGVYFTLALEKINLGSFDGIDEICDKAITLGVGLGRTNDYAFKSFNVWYTIALIQNAGMQDAQELSHQLQRVQRALLSGVGEGHVSYLQPNPRSQTSESRL